MIPYDYERGGYFDKNGDEWEEDHDNPRSAWNCVVLKRVRRKPKRALPVRDRMLPALRRGLVR